jgi:alpha-L-rhamnosidase
VQWIYENVAGLRIVGDGCERIVIRPDARAEVPSANIRTETVRGRVAVAWKKRSRVFTLDIQVPIGTTAEVHVPSAAASEVTAVPAPLAGEATYQDGYTIFTVPAGQWSFTGRSA